MGNDIWFKLANLLLNSSKCWIRYVIHGECTPIYQRGAPNSRHNHPNSLMFWKTDNSIRGLFHCPDVFITSQKSLGRWREPSKIWPRTSIIDLNLAKYPKHTVKKTETSKHPSRIKQIYMHHPSYPRLKNLSRRTSNGFRTTQGVRFRGPGAWLCSIPCQLLPPKKKVASWKKWPWKSMKTGDFKLVFISFNIGPWELK